MTTGSGAGPTCRPPCWSACSASWARARLRALGLGALFDGLWITPHAPLGAIGPLAEQRVHELAAETGAVPADGPRYHRVADIVAGADRGDV